ncbi:MAG: TAXI family TRAP transporter solute-binding subunit [Gammaproteobacteria bacterium]|nr:TAXI family TRAP transporter solute-binding subunit [Gammaproteobacteria bacterium]
MIRIKLKLHLTTDKNKQIWRSLLFLLLTLCPVAALADHLPPQSVMRLGAAEHGTGTFNTAVSLADVFHQESTRTRHSASHDHQFGVAMSSPGSIGNLRDLAAGRVEFGFVHANLANLALDAPKKIGLDQSVNRLRLVATMAPAVVQIVARRKLGDGTIRSLQGKRVSFGMTDTGQSFTATGLFTAHGMDAQSLNKFHFPLSLAVQKLKSRSLDAIVLIDQSPSPLLRRLLQDPEYRLLSLDASALDQLIEAGKLGSMHLVEKNPYDSTDKEFLSVAVDTYLLSHDMVAPSSVLPILKYVKKQNQLLEMGLPSDAPAQTFRVKGIESLLPMHDACKTIDAEELTSDVAGVSVQTDLSEPDFKASADH